jgi:tRNA pseudouridine38-40 synthase
VQDALETALSRISGNAIRVLTAGRTDAGVHAAFQVVHFDTEAQRPMSAWIRGVNAFLPDSIAVLWASQVPLDFHARYCAMERCYLYLLLTHPVRPALNQGKVGWFHRSLDLESMRSAARFLLGEHDFSAFRAAECQARSPVRSLTRLEITQQGDIVVFELRANAFLQHMVRNITGSLVYVGKGRYPPAWMAEVLAGRKRENAAPTFSPAGLYLAGIGYDAKWRIPKFVEPPWSAILEKSNRRLPASPQDPVPRDSGIE